MITKEKLDIVFNTNTLVNEITSKSFFDDNDHILKKGIIKHTITEDDDRDIPVTIIGREYSAFDGTLNYKEEIVIASSVFNERKQDIIKQADLKDKIQDLKEQVKIYSDKKEYETCHKIKTEMEKLEKFLKSDE